MIGLTDRADDTVGDYSGGMKRRVNIGAGLLHKPDILFLDEPTIGLDVIAQHNIQQFLRYYQEKRKITILLTSHYMKDVAALCRRVVVRAIAPRRSAWPY